MGTILVTAIELRVTRREVELCIIVINKKNNGRIRGLMQFSEIFLAKDKKNLLPLGLEKRS